MPIQELKGDILQTPEEVCIGVECGMRNDYVDPITKSVFDAYPESNVFKLKISRKIGQTSYHSCGPNKVRKVFVLCTKMIVGHKDMSRNIELRPDIFRRCLECISADKNITKIAMPKNIGYEPYQDKPGVYSDIIKKWIDNNPHITLFLFEN